MSKTLIVYHMEDNDGCCSAGLIKYYIVTRFNVREADIEYFPATYAILDMVAESGFTEFNGYNSIFFTDISFNHFSDMIAVYEKFGKDNFVWIDHHAPVIEVSAKMKYNTLMRGMRDVTRSAILNAYKYCYDPYDDNYQNNKAPIVLRYLSAWDSKTTSREKLDFNIARYINAGFKNKSKLNPEYWYKNMESILNPESQHLIEQLLDDVRYMGCEACKEYDELNEKIIRTAGIGGFSVNQNRSCILLFTSGSTGVLMFQSVYGQYDNAVCVKSDATGKVVISMYNIVDSDEFHCGNYLQKKYNGGGHKDAGGATITFEQLYKILQTKQI